MIQYLLLLLFLNINIHYLTISFRIHPLSSFYHMSKVLNDISISTSSKYQSNQSNDISISTFQTRYYNFINSDLLINKILFNRNSNYTKSQELHRQLVNKKTREQTINSILIVPDTIKTLSILDIKRFVISIIELNSIEKLQQVLDHLYMNNLMNEELLYISIHAALKKNLPNITYFLLNIAYQYQVLIDSDTIYKSLDLLIRCQCLEEIKNLIVLLEKQAFGIQISLNYPIYVKLISFICYIDDTITLRQLLVKLTSEISKVMKYNRYGKTWVRIPSSNSLNQYKVLNISMLTSDNFQDLFHKTMQTYSLRSNYIIVSEIFGLFLRILQINFFLNEVEQHKTRSLHWCYDDWSNCDLRYSNLYNEINTSIFATLIFSYIQTSEDIIGLKTSTSHPEILHFISILIQQGKDKQNVLGNLIFEFYCQRRDYKRAQEYFLKLQSYNIPLTTNALITHHKMIQELGLSSHTVGNETKPQIPAVI